MSDLQRADHQFEEFIFPIIPDPAMAIMTRIVDHVTPISDRDSKFNYHSFRCQVARIIACKMAEDGITTATDTGIDDYVQKYVSWGRRKDI